MANSKKVDECAFCGIPITLESRPAGIPGFAWKAAGGFYCPRSEGWHSPKGMSRLMESGKKEDGK